MPVDEIERRASDWLNSEELARRLALMDMDEAEAALRDGLVAVDGRLEILGLGEKPRGVTRVIELSWRHGRGGAERKNTILLPAAAP